MLGKTRRLQYIGGRKPHLVFFDVDGAKQEEIRCRSVTVEERVAGLMALTVSLCCVMQRGGSIGNWDEDAISEFIGAKLRPQEDAQGEEGVEDLSDTAEETVEDGDEVVEVEVKADASS